MHLLIEEVYLHRVHIRYEACTTIIFQKIWEIVVERREIRRWVGCSQQGL